MKLRIFTIIIAVFLSLQLIETNKIKANFSEISVKIVKEKAFFTVQRCP